MNLDLDKLLKLKFLTTKWKCLHESQVIQLKYYPFILPIESAEFHVNMNTHEIEYYCVAKKMIRKSKKNTQLCKNIYKWITTILWDDTTLRIFINGKLFYEQKE